MLLAEVAQVSTQLCEKLRLEVPTARLHKALELVLAHAVTLHADGSASVLSGKQTYTLAPHCPCPDAKNRAELCKHALAVELHRRALALLDGTAHAPAAAPASVPAAPSVAPAPAVPTSAAWHVQEAPTSACFKWRVGQAELTYTFRGVTDEEVLTVSVSISRCSKTSSTPAKRVLPSALPPVTPRWRTPRRRPSARTAARSPPDALGWRRARRPTARSAARPSEGSGALPHALDEPGSPTRGGATRRVGRSSSPRTPPAPR